MDENDQSEKTNASPTNPQPPDFDVRYQAVALALDFNRYSIASESNKVEDIVANARLIEAFLRNG